MKELFSDVIQINTLSNPQDAKASAEQFFSRLKSQEIPEFFNWAKEVFEDLHVASQPDKKALIWTDISTLDTKTYTYKILIEKANQLINYLSEAGIKKGDSLYTMMPVLPENWISCLAGIKAGVVNVPVSTDMSQRALEYRFETYAPDVIVADPQSADLIDKALDELDITPKLKLVVGEKDGWVSFETTDSQPIHADAAQTKSEDILFCFFTSGTTGLPKRVGHTAISFPVGHLSTTLMVGLGPDDIHNSLDEPGWAKWAWSSFFVPFNVGATTSGFNFSFLDGEQYLDALAKHNITSFCAPPAAWQMFVNMNLDSFDLSRIKESVSIGEPLNPDVSSQWKEQTSRPIREFYSQTEAAAMIGNPPWFKDQIKAGSFGRPLGMYEMTLADNIGNEITAPDLEGHIVIKLDKWQSIGLFSEYIGNPEKMSSVFVDNFYYTGDRASIDKDGYWFFRGRADDVIKSSDHRVGPFEVESALVEHPAVQEAAVIGAPDATRYQLIKAYVILSPSHEPTKAMALELFKHTATILPKSKVPRLIEFVTELPKTMSGKIRRIELRQMEVAKQGPSDNDTIEEYFYWDFPELGSKRKT